MKDYLKYLPLFDYSDCDGFQDIWLQGLSPRGIVSAFNYVSPYSLWIPEYYQAFSDSDSISLKDLLEISDPTTKLNTFSFDIKLDNLIFEGVNLIEQDVQVRNLDVFFVIDFQAGEKYFSPDKLEAMLRFLSSFRKIDPNINFLWSAEGDSIENHRVEYSLLLNEAINAVSPPP